MGILGKLMTALRGGAREAGEAIVDANGIRIFEQEIKDAESHIQKAKQDLTEVMSKAMQAGRKSSELEKNIKKHETYAAQALEKNDESLVLDIANKIVEMTEEYEIQKEAKSKFDAHTERLKGMVKKSTKSIAELKRQLVMVKTTASVQKATKAITNNYGSSGSKMLSAKESLDRIQQRQRDLDDRLAAGDLLKEEGEGGSLDDKLKAAGIGESSTSAQDILAKLKQKKA
jgi:phage shock protein A